MKHIFIFCFILFLCGCIIVSGKLRMNIDDNYTDYYKTVQLSFYGYVERPETAIMLPPLFISLKGSRNSEECHYYDNRYISVTMPASNYKDTISTHMRLQGDSLFLNGRIIAVHNMGDSIQIDFYFPLSCSDMDNATFYLMDGDKELLAVTTYYSWWR